MNNDSMQLTLLTLFALVLTVRYMASLTKGIKPVLLLRREKRLREKAIEAVPVAAVMMTALLILRNIFTPHIGAFLAAGFIPPLLIQRFGFLLSFSSFILLITAYWSLGSNWRVGTGDEEVKELVTGGVFAYTRNPVYLFFNMFLGGIFLINGHLLMLAFLALVSGSLHLLILEEEKLLERRFGSVYEDYRKTTPRYL